MAAIYSLYIINKSGGLIFYKVRISFWTYSFYVEKITREKKKKIFLGGHSSECQSKSIVLECIWSSIWENFSFECCLKVEGGLTLCMDFRIMDRRDEWTRMIACDWQVCGIRCMRFLSSYLQLWVARGSNSLRLIHSTSIASNRLLVHPKFIINP